MTLAARASALAGREVYSTTMARPFTRHGLLQHAPDVPTSDAHRLDAAPGSWASFALGLWTAVLAIGLVVGRRYIDPGSGSFAIQIIIAAVLGGLLTARLWLRHMFWRVLGLVRRKKSEEQPAGEEADR